MVYKNYMILNEKVKKNVHIHDILTDINRLRISYFRKHT